MHQFIIIVKHYLLRSILDPLNTIILLLLPLALMLVNTLLGQALGIDFEDVMVLSSTAMFMLGAFQIFSPLQHYYLFSDFQSSMRFRLYSAPISKTKFIISMGFAGWLHTVFIGLFFIFIASILFNVQWGNVFAVALALFLLSVFAQLVSVFLFFILPTRGAAEAGVQFVGWSTMILSGGIVNIGNNAFTEFLGMYGTPISLAGWGMFSASFPDADFGLPNKMAAPWLYFAILAAFVGVFAIITVIAGMLCKKEI